MKRLLIIIVFACTNCTSSVNYVHGERLPLREPTSLGFSYIRDLQTEDSCACDGIKREISVKLDNGCTGIISLYADSRAPYTISSIAFYKVTEHRMNKSSRYNLESNYKIKSVSLFPLGMTIIDKEGYKRNFTLTGIPYIPFFGRLMEENTDQRLRFASPSLREKGDE